MSVTKMHVAIPVLDESDWLLRCLDSLAKQTGVDFDVWVCVNQPDEWWNSEELQRGVCERNMELLSRLKDFQQLPLHIIDHSSPGLGWVRGKGGVGRARKTLMDSICENADKNDVIVSLDADTLVGESYLLSLQSAFKTHPAVTGISAPYHHRIGSDESLNRVMLRYEIYLRYYALNMWRIKSPYAFTAIGSAMACPVWAYRKIGGMSPRTSGEDFYFLQQLRKTGRLINWTDSLVYPGVRLSDRVPFGTGAAMKKGIAGNWTAYPIFSCHLFEDIEKTTCMFEDMYEHDVDTSVVDFLKGQLNTDDVWGSLRRNFKDRSRFVRACHERLDGLRIFQYLRASNKLDNKSDEEHMAEFMELHCTDLMVNANNAPMLSGLMVKARSGDFLFDTADIEELDAIRLFFEACENACRRKELENMRDG